MPKLPQPRFGQEVKSKKHAVDFSLFPTRRTNTRRALQNRVFISNPWGLIRQATIYRVKSSKTRNEALAFIDQASAFYSAAESTEHLSSHPLLLYYSFMNLVKAYLLASGHLSSLGQKLQHGLSEKSGSVKGNLSGAKLDAYKSPNSTGSRQIFDDFLQTFGRGISAKCTFTIHQVFPQLLPGHRLWCEANTKAERFISVDADFYEDTTSKQAWIVLNLKKKDIEQLGKTHTAIMKESGLKSNWEEVVSPVSPTNFMTIQQKVPISYRGRAADVLHKLAEGVREHLWCTVCNHSPYRKYYLHLSPSPRDVKARLPQPHSIYAFSYYLGSIARYQPYHFDKLLTGPYGAAIETFLTDQQSQFLYLMASYFAEREVAKANIV